MEWQSVDSDGDEKMPDHQPGQDNCECRNAGGIGNDKEKNEKSAFKNFPLRLYGFRNMGNTCYMNSGLQCFHRILPLSDFLLKYYSQMQHEMTRKRQEQEHALAQNLMKKYVEQEVYEFGDKVRVGELEGIYMVMSDNPIVQEEANVPPNKENQHEKMEGGAGNDEESSWKFWNKKEEKEKEKSKKMKKVKYYQLQEVGDQSGAVIEVPESAMLGKVIDLEEAKRMMKKSSSSNSGGYFRRPQWLESLLNRAKQEVPKMPQNLVTSWCELVQEIQTQGFLPSHNSHAYRYGYDSSRSCAPAAVRQHLGKYRAEFLDHGQHDSWMVCITLLNELQNEVGRVYPVSNPQFEFQAYSNEKAYPKEPNPQVIAKQALQVAQLVMKKQLEKSKGKSPFVDTLGGVMVCKRKCLSCGVGYQKHRYSYFEYLPMKLTSHHVKVALLVPAWKGDKPIELKNVHSGSRVSILRELLRMERTRMMTMMMRRASKKGEEDEIPRLGEEKEEAPEMEQDSSMERVLNSHRSSFWHLDTNSLEVKAVSEQEIIQDLHGLSGSLMLLPIEHSPRVQNDMESPLVTMPVVVLLPSGDVSLHVVPLPAVVSSRDMETLRTLQALAPQGYEMSYLIHQSSLLQVAVSQQMKQEETLMWLNGGNSSLNSDVCLHLSEAKRSPLIVVLREKQQLDGTSQKWKGKSSNDDGNGKSCSSSDVVCAIAAIEAEYPFTKSEMDVLRNFLMGDSKHRNTVESCRNVLKLMATKMKEMEKDVSTQESNCCTLGEWLNCWKSDASDQLQRKVGQKKQVVKWIRQVMKVLEEQAGRIEADIAMAKLGLKQNFGMKIMPIVSEKQRTLDNLQEMVDLQYNSNMLYDDASLSLTCPNCHQSKLLSDCEEILMSPQYLLIQLNRAYLEGCLNQYHVKDKMDHAVKFPISNLRIPTLEGPKTYQLVAASMHSGGSAKGGHYTALVRDHQDWDTWYDCNDSSVSVSSHPPCESRGYNAAFLVYQMQQK